MIAIRFPEPEYVEEGLRTIITSGLVEYTSERGVYKIPNYVTNILESKKIPFVRIDEQRSKRRKKF